MKIFKIFKISVVSMVVFVGFAAVALGWYDNVNEFTGSANSSVTNEFKPTNIGIFAPVFKPEVKNTNFFAPNFSPKNTNEVFVGVSVESFANQTLIFQRDFLPLPAPFSVALPGVYVDPMSKGGWNTGGLTHLLKEWTAKEAGENDGGVADFKMTVFSKKPASNTIKVQKGEPVAGTQLAVAWVNGKKNGTPGQIVASIAKEGMAIGAKYACIFEDGVEKLNIQSSWGLQISLGPSGQGPSAAGSANAGSGYSSGKSKGAYEDYFKVVYVF